MSLYMKMWKKVKEATPEERKEFLEGYGPARGLDVEFRGEIFFDVDLLEALRNAKDHDR